MKQVTQTLKSGIIEICDVPIPSISNKFLLVSNICSVISSGTEKTKIDMGRKSLLQKAKARPDLVKQVVKKIQTEGIAKTVQTVKARLESPSPLGYSTSGIVIAVGGLVKGIAAGDRVACAGAGYANHAEVIAVPQNLVTRIPDNVSDEDASFTTIGAIAIQGLRLAQPTLGETFLVLGLGLIGQITVQLLHANGCRVIGTDLDDNLVALAEEFGAKGIKSTDDAAQACLALTGGHGVDGVIICAGTSSNGPIELAGGVTRLKGRVVVVGAVRMDIPREPYFKKEINVVISRSYGPGRYDPFYEENGNDYPLGYVRFTEQRNMESFLRLVSEGKVDIQKLITHRFTLDHAPEAYQLIEGEKKESYLGIVLQYPEQTEFDHRSSPIELKPKKLVENEIGISLFGAGNYATATLLPILAKLENAHLRGISTASGRSARGVGERLDFAYCDDGVEGLLKEDTHALVVATRHDTHSASVVAGLNAGKHVYVEKPLALTVSEWQSVVKALQRAEACQLMVGYNRRFSPLTRKLMEHFKGINSPLMINIRVNAGAIPADHWIQDPLIGGGRLIGEGCHFIDLTAALAGSLPVEVYTIATSHPGKSPVTNDNVVVSLKFANGSAASVTYTSAGSKAMPKEQIEVFGGRRSAVLRDFKSLELFQGDTKSKKIRLASQDKGQKDMLQSWWAGLRNGRPCVPVNELLLTSLASIHAVESLMIGSPLPVLPPELEISL